MLGCLMEGEIIASCCLIDTKPRDLLKLQDVQEHVGGDAAVCGEGKHGWLLQVSNRCHVRGSICPARSCAIGFIAGVQT